MYVGYPLSLRQVEDLLFERGIDICHETVRLWWCGGTDSVRQTSAEILYATSTEICVVRK